MPALFACGHPATTDNTYVGKTLNGPNAGRVLYSCKQCHRERDRIRRFDRTHTWVVMLEVKIASGAARAYQRAAQSEGSRFRRFYQHHRAQVLEVYCIRCRCAYPAARACEPPPKPAAGRRR